MSDPAPKRLVTLISGTGSNLQAILDALDAGTINATMACVVSNRADAAGLDKARAAGVATGDADALIREIKAANLDAWVLGNILTQGISRSGARGKNPPVLYV